MRNSTLTLVGAVLLLGACKKDSENQPTPPVTTPSNAELLTAKSWRVTAKTTTISGNGQTTSTDDYAASKPCERDNFTKFSTNSTMVIDEGATKCSSSDPQTSTGSWAFAGNNKQMVLSTQVAAGVSYSLTFDILELTATTMRLRYTDTSYVPYTTVQEVTFTAF